MYENINWNNGDTNIIKRERKKFENKNIVKVFIKETAEKHDIIARDQCNRTDIYYTKK